MNSWLSHRRLVKEVSRSFYLSIRWLPQEMREPAALGYLLARLTDTLADSSGRSVPERSAALHFVASRLLQGGSSQREDSRLPEFASDLVRASERRLLLRSESLFDWLERIDPSARNLLIDLMGEIISGQLWDLEFFHQTHGEPACCSSDELMRYTYQVAGCVGEFWTRLGYLRLGGRFAAPELRDSLLGWGKSLGQGLQLINIIRDLHEDLPAGRCYLGTPQPDASLIHQWLQRCRDLLSQGFPYVEALCHPRVKLATALPLRLALATADRLEKAGHPALLHSRIKVPRFTVGMIFFRVATAILIGKKQGTSRQRTLFIAFATVLSSWFTQ